MASVPTGIGHTRAAKFVSIPVGVLALPGYHMHIHPPQAAVVRRIFDQFAAGVPVMRIFVALNEEGVPTPTAGASGWGPSTVDGILRNLKYTGTWTWNRTGKRRDPRTGRRHSFIKPVEEHVVSNHPDLRIIPQSLWDDVQACRAAVARSGPGASAVASPAIRAHVRTCTRATCSTACSAARAASRPSASSVARLAATTAALLLGVALATTA